MLRDYNENLMDCERALVFTDFPVIIEDLHAAAARAFDLVSLLNDPNVNGMQFLGMAWLSKNVAEYVFPKLLLMAVDGRYGFGTRNADLRGFLAKNGLEAPPELVVDGPLDRQAVIAAAAINPDAPYVIR
jgi:hypothetical protein